MPQLRDSENVFNNYSFPVVTLDLLHNLDKAIRNHGTYQKELRQIIPPKSSIS